MVSDDDDDDGGGEVSAVVVWMYSVLHGRCCGVENKGKCCSGVRKEGPSVVVVYAGTGRIPNLKFSPLS